MEVKVYEYLLFFIAQPIVYGSVLLINKYIFVIGFTFPFFLSLGELYTRAGGGSTLSLIVIVPTSIH